MPRNVLSPRILIAEDIPLTAKLLRDGLYEEFPVHLPQGAIDVAATSVDAEDLLRKADQEYRPYSIVIRDVMLPKVVGGPVENAVDLGDDILRFWEDTVVFIISAHANDPDIREYVARRQQPRSARPLFISKIGPWEEELYRWIRQVIHGDRIKQALRAVFVHSEEPREVAGSALRPQVAYGSHAAAGDATQEIAALSRDIAAHWRFLDKNLQDRVLKVFSVQEIDGDIHVGLF
jgi:hypothetical protein